MSGRAGPTLIGALVILVSMPIALFVFLNLWRSRIDQPLPEAHPSITLASPEPEAPPPAPATLRPVDELLIGVFEGRGPGPGKDLLPNGPRVDLTGATNGTVARVDLDRDGAWDEVWSIRLDEIVREVSPQDDGKMSERWSWMNGAWVPVP